MKKSEILREVFGSRVVSYSEDLKFNNLLVIELEEFIWSDLTPEMIKAFIGIRPTSNNTIELAMECYDWD